MDELLEEIGRDLDRHQFPCVYPGGIVLPCGSDAISMIQGKKAKKYDNRRPQTRPWKGPPRGQGPTGTYRSRSTNNTPPVICPDLRSRYETEITSIGSEYPDTEVWCQEEGMWLLTKSSVLPGLKRAATFLTGIPYVHGLYPKSWGFWETTVSTQWIGSRHTNFPDGSVCAFAPNDGTWVIGQGLLKLLDIYSLWALRHLYLERFCRWPGYQYIPFPSERLLELTDTEFCGCQNSDQLYCDCCKPKDLASDKLPNLWRLYGKAKRQPPTEISKFMKDRHSPPPVLDFFPKKKTPQSLLIKGTSLVPLRTPFGTIRNIVPG